MTEDEALRTLRERRTYLAKRAGIKAEMGWDWQYETREVHALTLAIDALEADHG